MAREEVLANVLRWLRLVIEHHFAFTAQMYDKERLLHRLLPDTLWDHMRNYLTSLAGLPCWFDKNLSTTVFGPKQNLDFWEKVFQTGRGSVHALRGIMELDPEEGRSAWQLLVRVLEPGEDFDRIVKTGK